MNLLQLDLCFDFGDNPTDIGYHRVTDNIYFVCLQSAKKNCKGEFFNVDPNNDLCHDAIELMKEVPRTTKNFSILKEKNYDFIVN